MVRDHLGSNPGSRRRIAPIRIKADRIEARCYTSNAVKPFMLSKIEIVDPDAASGPIWTATPAKPALLIVADPVMVMETCRSALEAAAWHVSFSEDDGISRIELRTWFKNGKLRRTASHELRYTPTTFDLIGLEDGATIEANHRPNPRPWTTWGIGYADLRKPLTAFMTAAGVPSAEIDRAISEIERRRG